MRVAVVFPGQGTQSSGMAGPWKGEPAWSIVETAEAALDESLAHLVLDADAAELARTRNAQLAVLTTSLLAWEAARDEIAAHHEIVAFAGHSLGQVTALIAAGTLTLADGIRFAARRAELTQAAADAHPGRMAALLGATLEHAEAACAATDECWIANDNAPGQIVVAGTPAGIETALAAAKSLGVRRTMSLSVGGAFHTPLMADARAGLVEALAAIPLRAPRAPVVSNADALAHDDGEGWRTRLADHPLQPVRWRESMLTLAAAPLAADAFVEVGHGSMIAGVARRTVTGVAVIGIAGPDDLAHLTDDPQES